MITTETLPSETSNPGKGLTKRELEVMTLIGEGLRSKEVAERLYVSKRTIDFHLSNAYEKLGARNRTQAIRTLMAQGILT